MVAKVKIEDDGGFVIPKEILDRLQLKDGGSITLEDSDEYIVLRKAAETPSDDPIIKASV